MPARGAAVSRAALHRAGRARVLREFGLRMPPHARAVDPGVARPAGGRGRHRRAGLGRDAAAHVPAVGGEGGPPNARGGPAGG